MADSDKENSRIANILKGKYTQNSVCPVKDIMASYGDKWSIFTVLLLGSQKQMRFSELRTAIDGISQRMLTVTLRSLERDGIISRMLYPAIPSKIEYSLTVLGESLFQQMSGLAVWAQKNLNDIVNSRRKP